VGFPRPEPATRGLHHHHPEPCLPPATGPPRDLHRHGNGGYGSYEYQFVRREPQGSWAIIRPYSSASTWTWDTTGAALGAYVIQVWVRNAGSTVAYDTSTGTGFTLNAGTPGP
jgi:hypothetical protein